MLEWFENVGYGADIAGLELEFGRRLTSSPPGHADTRDQLGAETRIETNVKERQV